MLLLKTLGGSSIIRLLFKALRLDIPKFYLKLYYLWCAATVEYFFRSEYNLFVPCPNQMNVFNVILNVIEQIDIYQHFKYRTISVLNNWT